MNTETKPPPENLFKAMKELSEIRTLQELVNRNLKAVDKHIEEVAKPKVN